MEAFVRDGFVRIDDAFGRNLAAEARAILWRAADCVPENPATWPGPVVRLGQFGGYPFREAANTPRLHAAFDRLVGPGRWLPCEALGTFPIRFPAEADPGDTGWHVDAAFGTENPDFMEWRINLVSRGRALLMLFLFTDIGPEDAPTRIRVGSHQDIAKRLATAGDTGLSLRDLVNDGIDRSAHRPEIEATGPAGTVYLCHPFLVHSAQIHRGQSPRIIAQPPLLAKEPFRLDGPIDESAPVEQAIQRALALP